MATSIPIKLSFATVPTAIKAANINQLLSIVTKYVQGFISADVSLFKSGTSDPSSDQGPFYNTTSNVWKYWSSDSGKYLPITELQIGDVKANYIPGDDAAHGWIALDGRKVDVVEGITIPQKNVLETLYGVSGTLPSYSFTGALNGLPADGTFSGISNPTVQPINGVIGSLKISSAYDSSEEQALRDNTETLRDSTDSTQKALSSAIAGSEALLNVLNAASATGGPSIKVFVGYP